MYIDKMDNLSKQQEDFFKSSCKKFGLKITPQRIAVYTELVKATDHPSIEAIHSRVKKKIENVSFDTIYRTMLSFLEAGLITLVEGTGEQKRFEPKLSNHHHCRCIKCHAIIDFEISSQIDFKIPHEVRQDFTVLRERIVLEGLCKKCKTKKK